MKRYGFRRRSVSTQFPKEITNALLMAMVTITSKATLVDTESL